jgi:hypothetical protein
MFLIGIVVLVLGLGINASVWAQMSPLNLAPGFPTQLDDAYPINPGTVAFQPAFRFDKVESHEMRVRQTIDVRWGVAHGAELFASGTTTWGPLAPGALDDPRAVRVGLLYRLSKQNGDTLLPSLAIRTTAQIPVTGPTGEPSIRTEVLGSWDLGSEWWYHMNAGIQVTPGFRPGLQSPGQPSVWYGRAGLVKALAYNIGAVANVTYGQDPTLAQAYVWTPELGLMWGITREWILTMGAGHDFGSSAQKATVRANVGLSWVW